MNELFLSQQKSLGIKQNPNLLLSIAMQQAFKVLQMPVLELSEWLKIQIEQNPVLEYEDSLEIQEDRIDSYSDAKELDFEQSRFEVLEGMDDLFQESAFSESKDWSKIQEEKRIKNFQETLIPYRLSLYEYLMQQAKQIFYTDVDLEIAETIIGNLDERGFLNHCFSTIEPEKINPILTVIQTFDPPGIGAKNLQESLLIQLKIQGKGSSFAYRIIDTHYDDLIHNRIASIQKKLKCSANDLRMAIQTDIAPLDINPGYRFHFEPFQSIVPDILIKKENDQWSITINEEMLPQFKITSSCFKAFTFDELCLSEKRYIRRHVASGKWLHRIIQRRHKTLKSIASCLIQRQSAFFNGDKKELVPMTMSEISQELGMHESTVARAISEKYLSCPQGLFPMRSFFTAALTSESGEKISNFTVKQTLAKIIRQEDKDRPLSDRELSTEIKKMGMPCARRTIAKYRKSLKIGPASCRRGIRAKNKRGKEVSI
ncbi:MAG TPA: RNA polymerase factor sigma-54 [Rhabdochlamydiaceae bacterium]|nr:RNA polymerase factor sigma-54 [Rhabdochlamydiaceae bacterium]